MPAATISSEPDSRMATIKCSPLEIGEYKFGIRAFDDGNPSKDTTTQVSLTINKKRNNQPALTVKSFEIYAGEPIEIELVATDEDPQIVQISLFENEQLPSGTLTQVEGESKAIFTHPPIEEVKRYEFQVKLDDGGEPRMRNDQPVDNLKKIALNILPAKFVEASQTKITSIINLNGVDRAWINVRPIGVQHDVVVGDSFEVDRKTWTVKSISVANREVILEVDNVIKTYQFGDFLSEPRSEEKLPDNNSVDEKSISADESAESNQAAVAKLKPEPPSSPDK